MQGAVMLVVNRETRREYAAKIIDTRKCVHNPHVHVLLRC
jgi:beta-lactamase regulating signal transducer with metallopeptidase domain